MITASTRTIEFLRLYSGDSSKDTDRPSIPKEQWTIRQAFEQQKRPLMLRQGRAAPTLKKWEKAVWYWEQVTDNPPIGQVDDELLNVFAERLLERERRFDVNTNTTANQNQMYIQSILKSCEKHLEHVPKGTPLPLQAATKHRRIVPPDLLARIYQACDSAKYDLLRCPWVCRSIPAPLLMRSVVTLFLCIGCRRTEGLTMERTAYVRHPEFPDLPECGGMEIDADSPHGWLVFHTPKTRARKSGLPLVLPVAPVLAAHLDLLDELAPHRKRLLPLGDSVNTWQNLFRRVQDAAGIENPYCWQELRKTANRMYRRAAGRDVAKYMLGQQPRGVNAAFYDDMTQDAVEAVARIQLPNCFQDFTGGVGPLCR